MLYIYLGGQEGVGLGLCLTQGGYKIDGEDT